MFVEEIKRKNKITWLQIRHITSYHSIYHIAYVFFSSFFDFKMDCVRYLCECAYASTYNLFILFILVSFFAPFFYILFFVHRFFSSSFFQQYSFNNLGFACELSAGSFVCVVFSVCYYYYYLTSTFNTFYFVSAQAIRRLYIGPYCLKSFIRVYKWLLSTTTTTKKKLWNKKNMNFCIVFFFFVKF